jgi:putative transposase
MYFPGERQSCKTNPAMRPKAILQSDFPYNISARCINREWFSIPMGRVWEIFSEELTETSLKLNLQIHSFVLMSNHYHLIASTPDANISQCMHRFMMRTSHQLARAGNRINETFAGRHYKTILQKNNYYLDAYKYVYRNPVTAGICEWVEDYPYSTLHGLVKRSSLTIPLIEDAIFSADPLGTLKWLNTKPDPLKLEAVRFALRRQYFKPKKDRILNKPLLADDDIL